MRFRRKRPFCIKSGLHRFTRQQNDGKDTQHCSEGHKQTFATRDNKNKEITSALGEKSPCDNDADGETLPGKKKAAAQNDKQPTEDGRRRLIARKPATNHHHTDGQMNKWKTSEQRCKPADDIVKYREQLKMLFFLRGQRTKR